VSRINPTFKGLTSAQPPKIPIRMESQLERALSTESTQFTNAEIREIMRVTYQEDFREFIKDFWGEAGHGPGAKPMWNWHIDAMAEHLMAQSRGQLQRLIINVPPGAGKSILVGVLWPCWEWTWNPQCQILATSANSDLSNRDNQKARWVLESEKYQELFPLELKADSNSVGKFTNQHFGFRQAVPFTSLTGNRGDRVIIDDAISAANARSDDMRKGVNQKFWEGATSRVNNPMTSTFTIVQQRLHMDDLVGSILEKQEEDWYTLILPMEYTKTTHYCKNPIGFKDPRTEEGELLFPARWDAADIQRRRKESSYVYASQYQQNPVPDEDGFFSPDAFLRYTRDKSRVNDRVKLLPNDLHYYITSDHAMGLSGKGDFNVVRVWGLDEHKNIYLIDSLREKCTFNVAMGITMEGGKLSAGNTGVMGFIKKYRPLCWYPDEDNIFKTNQGMIVETMRASNIWCRIEIAKTMGNGKLERATAYQGMSQLGMVFLPEGPVGNAAIDEYAQFPNGKHDDQVDADSILPRMILSSHAAIQAPLEDTKKKTGDYSFWDSENGDDTNWSMFF